MTKRLHSAIDNFHSLAYSGESVEIPAARAKSRDLEHPEQVKVIRWWHDNHRAYGCPELSLFAIPNANKRTQWGGERLKNEGMRSGVADLFLAAPLFPWGGAFCEMKSDEGSLSIAQSTFLYAMEMEGYFSAVCYGADEAIKFFSDYLGEPNAR